LEVLLVIVSISPVPKLLPGPVSYFQSAPLTPVPAAPLKSSLQVVVKPAGGPGTACGAAAGVAGAAAGVAAPPVPVAAVIPATLSAATARAARPSRVRERRARWPRGGAPGCSAGVRAGVTGMTFS